MTTTTTPKLRDKLRTRIARLAKETGRSPHSLMVEALEREVAREEQIREFVREALASDAKVNEGAAVYAAEDVHALLEQLARNPKAARPKPVAQIVYSENALDNLERVFSFLIEHDRSAAMRNPGVPGLRSAHPGYSRFGRSKPIRRERVGGGTSVTIQSSRARHPSFRWASKTQPNLRLAKSIFARSASIRSKTQPNLRTAATIGAHGAPYGAPPCE